DPGGGDPVRGGARDAPRARARPPPDRAHRRVPRRAARHRQREPPARLRAARGAARPRRGARARVRAARHPRRRGHRALPRHRRARARRPPGRARRAARRPGMSAERARVVFLLDVDNTLVDNDRIAGDLRRYLTREVGAERQERYWAIFEELRAELGYADYLGALQRYRVENPREPHLLAVSSFLVNYPFANRLYPESLDVLEHLAQWGPTVILSD